MPDPLDLERLPAETLARFVSEARQWTLDLVAGLTDEQLFGPEMRIVNPILWEIGHVAWFQERWVLREWAGHRPTRDDGDVLYNSAEVHHDTRWGLPLPDREETLAYLRDIRDRTLDVLGGSSLDRELRYFALLSVFHEDMHHEAFAYTRQTHGWSPPPPPGESEEAEGDAAAEKAGPLPGDVEIPGGVFFLGAAPSSAFVFDNEQWAHPTEVAPFRMARAPVTQSELLDFVEDEGYSRRDLWSEPGWQWRESVAASHPVYWRREGDGWQRREFDRWVSVEPHRPAIHVNWYEADAYCRWAGRRLPREVEWEVAASGSGERDRLADTKRHLPWGDAMDSPTRARLDARRLRCADVAAHGNGDSAFGCRQMIGNVWEWTADDFGPFPGFERGPYVEYSEPWFGNHKVLRGGAWITRTRTIRNTWRNFYTPDRRDPWVGFRTCAIDS